MSYQIRLLTVGKPNLWSSGTIQGIGLADDEEASLFCLGTGEGEDWHPLLVDGKIGYAFRLEDHARQVAGGQPPSALLPVPASPFLSLLRKAFSRNRKALS